MPKLLPTVYDIRIVINTLSYSEKMEMYSQCLSVMNICGIGCEVKNFQLYDPYMIDDTFFTITRGPFADKKAKESFVLTKEAFIFAGTTKNIKLVDSFQNIMLLTSYKKKYIVTATKIDEKSLQFVCNGGKSLEFCACKRGGMFPMPLRVKLSSSNSIKLSNTSFINVMV